MARSDAITASSCESDEALALRAGSGSLAAFDLLVRRYERRIYSFLRRRCRNADDLEDLTQNTFLEAWRSIERYSAQWRFSTWLYTIATRQLTAWLRRMAVNHRAMLRLAEYPAPESDPEPGALASHAEQLKNLWCIAETALDPLQQTALWLRYAESFSIAEVAKILNRSPVTTRVVLFRARQALRAAVECTEEERGTQRSAPVPLQLNHSPLVGRVSHAAAG